MADNKNMQDLEFEQMMQQRIKNNFSTADNSEAATDERLKAMNKKLPSWNLEPPYNFLK